jgi:hypothetical protein
VWRTRSTLLLMLNPTPKLVFFNTTNRPWNC